MGTKLIAQTARGPKFIVVDDDGWAVEPFTWSLDDGGFRYGLAAVNELATTIDDYMDEWGVLSLGRLRAEKGAEAWRFFMPLGLDVDAGQAPDPAPAGFAGCCEVLAAAMGLMSITADGQQLWAVTNGGEDLDESNVEDVGEDESDEESYEDEDV